MIGKRHTILMLGIATLVLVVVTVIFFLSTPPMDPQDTTEKAAIETTIHEELSQTDANVVEANQAQVLLNPQFQNPTGQFVDSISDIAISRLRNPIHPGRSALRKRLRQETAEETFMHLPDMDGVAMCFLQLHSIGFAPGNYDSDTAIITGLTPVRKFLKDAREHPEKIVPFLEQQLIEMSKLQQKKCEEYARLKVKVNGLVTSPSPGLPEDTQDVLRSTAAVYVLSEIGACQSLPVIAWLSELRWPLTNPNDQYTRTVSKKFLFYAMHTLVSQMSEESLSEQAVQARLQYLELAQTARIPESTRVRVTSWDAYYHEQDFRRTTLQKKLNMEAEPTIEMSHYPELHMEEQDLEPLLAAQRKFTKLAFPDAKVLQ